MLKKKKKLNEQLYNINLECAAYWPNTWQLIQTKIERKLQQQMETYYIYLNEKLDCLQQKHPKQPRSPHYNEEHQQFYPRIKNVTNIKFKEEEIQLLKYGLNYSIKKPTATYCTNLLAETARIIKKKII